MSDRLQARTWRDLGTHWRAPLALHLLLQGLGAAVLAPLLSWIANRIVLASGDHVISNFDIAAFVLSPPGVAFVLVVAALTLGLLLAELAGHTWIAGLALARRPVEATVAIAAMTRRLPQILALATWVFLRLALLALPFVAFGGAYWFTALAGHDINYYLAESPPAWHGAKWLAIALGLGYLLVASWHLARCLYVLPILLFEDAGVRAALQGSADLTRGRVLQIALPVIRWWLVLALIYLTLTLLGREAAAASLGWAGIELRRVLPVMAVILAATVLVATMFGGLGLAGQQFLVTRKYAEARDPGRWAVARDVPLAPSRDRRLGRPVIAATLAVSAGALGSAWFLATRLTLKGDVSVTAHRGASHHAPENTMAAFRQAMAAGADYIELDVQHSKDGQLVVVHDADLMRLAGDPRRVRDLTVADLAVIDVGRRYDPAFAGEHVPTLPQVIDLVRGHAKLNIELKYNVRDPGLAPDVVNLLRQLHFEDQAVVSSLDYGALKQVKTLAPELAVGHIVTAAVGEVSRSQADFLSLNSARATRALLRRAHAHGKDVAVWTVNAPEAMARMIELGVDNIITDDPALLVRIMRDRNGLGAPEMLALRLRVLFGHAPAELTDARAVTPL